MNSEIYLSIIIILGLIVLSLVIALIVVAARQSSPIIYFDHYTAECMTMFFNGDTSGPLRVQETKYVVFSDYSWYAENYFEKKVISRLLSTKHDDSTIACEHIGDHDNCYIASSNDENNFQIPRSAVKQGTEVDCKEYATLTGRTLDKCDVYTYSQGSWVKKAFVESGTNYPVMVQTTQVDADATITETYYMSFNPEKPTDKSGLKAFDGVNIYDFRNGKGDAGLGKSNIYTKATLAETLLSPLFYLFSHSNRLNSKEAESERDPLDIYMKPLAMNKELREMLHLPPMGLPSKFLARKRSNATRDIRDIPSSFDAREKWTNCKWLINTIKDQDACGSCWAMAGSAVLSDRYCIASGAKINLSPQYLVYCASHSNGCSGTETETAVWEDIKSIGIPPESCVPFKGHNGECPRRCEDGTPITNKIKVYPTGYTVPWGKTDAERVEAIQKEIMTNGPVEAFYLVFTDFSPFFTSSNGIYHRSVNAKWKGGGHAIRIIGWGTEAGEDYWLIANSYNTDNPGKGFFRMRRGNNECNIEEQVAAGIFS